ncbi:FMN reductase [compost metagenome]
MSILFVVGSPHAGSRSSQVLGHVQKLLEREGHRVGWLNLGELPAEDLVHQRRDSLPIARALDAVKKASGVVIASPIYKSAPAGLVKVFLDILPRKALDGKVLLTLATAGGAAHYLSLEYSLRPVLAALGGVHIAPPVYLEDRQLLAGTEGGLSLDTAATERLEAGLDHFLHGLRRLAEEASGVAAKLAAGQ